jgi:hypothetical protein
MGLISAIKHAASAVGRTVVDLGETVTAPVVDSAQSVAHSLSTIHDFVDHPPLDPAVRRRLDAEASLHAQARGQRKVPLNRARLAHLSNTPDELSAALKDPRTDWIEGDLRLEGMLDLPGREEDVLLSHGANTVGGLTLKDWVRTGMAANLKLKLDFSKDLRTLGPSLELLRAAHVPDKNLILNVHVVGAPGSSQEARRRQVYDTLIGTTASLDDLRAMRRMFPGATLALGMTKTRDQGAYTPDQIRTLVDRAKKTGGPLMFPLQADLATPSLIRQLSQLGKVSIWNDLRRAPHIRSEREAEIIAEKFRKLGCDGLVDIRPTE